MYNYDSSINNVFSYTKQSTIHDGIALLLGRWQWQWRLRRRIRRRWRQDVVTVASQQDAIEAVEDLRVGVSLDRDVGDSHLQRSPEAAEPASHSGHRAELDERGEARSEFVAAAAGDGGRVGVVEPEHAGDAGGAVVDGEAEEAIMLEVAQRDSAHGFHARDRDSSAEKRRRGVRRRERGLG